MTRPTFYLACLAWCVLCWTLVAWLVAVVLGVMS